MFNENQKLSGWNYFCLFDLTGTASQKYLHIKYTCIHNRKLITGYHQFIHISSFVLLVEEMWNNKIKICYDARNLRRTFFVLRQFV